jgi:hypothetical protein
MWALFTPASGVWAWQLIGSEKFREATERAERSMTGPVTGVSLERVTFL